MPKKLSLHRETLRKLDGAALAEVAGATLAPSYVCTFETTFGGGTITPGFKPPTLPCQSNNAGCLPTSHIGC